MPRDTRRNSAAKRSEAQLNARETVTDNIQEIEDLISEINDVFPEMHERDKTKIGIAITAYNLDKGNTTLNAFAGSGFVLEGFLRKLTQRVRSSY